MIDIKTDNVQLLSDYPRLSGRGDWRRTMRLKAQGREKRGKTKTTRKHATNTFSPPTPSTHPHQDDLVFLPPKLTHALGGLGPLVLVTRVTAGITLTDPSTLREAVLDAVQFWRAPFKPLLSSRSLAEYVVLDVERVSGDAGSTRRHTLADVTLARKSDFGVNDRTCVVRTHLGAVLHAGDEAVGYDLATAAPSDAAFDAACQRGYALPDALLVRKSFAEARRRRRARGERRPWVLKRMAVDNNAEADEATDADRARSRTAARAAAVAAVDAGGEEADMERFLEEIEEDADLRKKISLYRDPAASLPLDGGAGGAAPMDASDGGSGSEDNVPTVPLEELLDALELEDEGEGEAAAARGDADADASGGA